MPSRKAKVLEALPLLIEDAQKHNLDQVEPNSELLRKANEIVFNFIKKNERILYGGLALHMFLIDSGHKGIYSDDKIFDYDFYTTDIISDSVRIANELYKEGFRNIRVQTAISPTTRKVFIDFGREAVADVTYLSEEIFQYILKNKTKRINDVICADPNFLKLDLYKILSYGLFEDYHRFDKVYERIGIMEEIFPDREYLSKSKVEPQKDNKSSLELAKALLACESNCLMGKNAIDTLIANKLVVGEYPIEIYSTEASKVIEIVKKHRKGQKLTIKYISQFSKILPKSIQIWDEKGTFLASIYYSVAASAIVKIDKYNVSGYYLTLYYLYIHQFLAELGRSINRNYSELIQKIKSERKKRCEIEENGGSLRIFDNDIFFNKYAEQPESEKFPKFETYYPDPKMDPDAVIEKYKKVLANEKIPLLDYTLIKEEIL
jgi:hypothetical protein